MYNNMALKKANRHGEVSEWSIVPSWKGGVPQGTAGSNPVLSAKKNLNRIPRFKFFFLHTDTRRQNKRR